MAKKIVQSKQELDYQIKKIGYHTKKLQQLGMPVLQIKEHIDLMPSMPCERLVGHLNLFLQPTIWRYLLFAVWRFEIDETASDETKTVVGYKIGPYKNSYMRKAEAEERETMVKLFLEPLEFEYQMQISCWNNAKYLELYKTSLPVPLEQMKKVIELLQVRKDAPNCADNREAARNILSSIQF